jgi:hypothetical protein
VYSPLIQTITFKKDNYTHDSNGIQEEAYRDGVRGKAKD